MWLWAFALGAQNTTVPLRTVLEKVEQRFSLSFTYLDKNISDININPPQAQWNLEQTLSFLADQSGLQFRVIDDGYVAISIGTNTSTFICGFVVDSENGNSVEGASIRTVDKFTVTDGNGYFEIERPKSGVLILESLGYQSQKLDAQQLGADCEKISFKPQYTNLEPVVINNYLTEGIYKTLDGSFTISTEALGILPGLIEPDVLQTLQALPGIQSINETVSNINVRGGTHDQNLVLWDGIKMYQSGHFFGLISAFNPYLAQEVRLIKNGSPSYFSDGVSSIIDIRSDNKVASKPSGGVGINLISADGYLNLPLGKKVSLQVSGRRSIADVAQTPIYSQYFDRVFRDTEITSNPGSNQTSSDQNFYFYDFSGKLLIDPSEQDRVRLNFINVYNDIDYQENATIGGQTETRTSGLIQQNLGASISYERFWSPKFKTGVLLYVSDYTLSAVNFDIFNDRRLVQENDVLDTGLKIDGTWILSPTLTWSQGYQFTEVGITNLEDISNPQFRRRIKNVLRTHSGFSEINWDSQSGSRSIKLGVRANYWEELETLRIEPRLSINQQFWDHFTFELLGELKSQTTTQVIDFQTDFLGVENRRWRLSNGSDIPVVESIQASSGLHYQKDGLLLSAEFYYKEVQGITTASQGFRNQFEFVKSSGDYQTYGLDVLFNQRLGAFNTWVSYSFAENDFDFSGLNPAEFPNNLDIRHTVSAGISYTKSNFNMSIGGNWRTGRPFTEPQSLNVVNDIIDYNLPNQERLQDYIRLDISATYRFKLTETLKASLGGSLWNVLDRQNIITTYYRIENTQPTQVQRAALGITPNVVFRVEF